MVQADLNEVATLEKAFEGANLIFSVTDYWEPFFRQREIAQEKGLSCREWAGKVEFSEWFCFIVFIFTGRH